MSGDEVVEPLSASDGPAEPPSIPGYELLECLGRGGMGLVYRARQKRLDREVAIKLLRPELGRDREYVQRFLIEARTAGKLRHLNIVSAIDCGVVGEVRFFVMEYVEGRPLDRILEERGPLDERAALEIVKQVAEGLDHAWKHGIIHRDIKPQNLLMTSDRIVKICDLGLCKSVRRDVKLTSTGYVNCTPTHASPEQAKGDVPLDCRTDLYSLGVTFHQLVTGVLPFQGTSPADLFVKHATAPRVPPSNLNPKVSRPASDLILRLLDPERDRRPATPQALAEEIRRLLAGEVAAVNRAVPSGRRAAPALDLLNVAGIEARAGLKISTAAVQGGVVLRLEGKLTNGPGRTRPVRRKFAAGCPRGACPTWRRGRRRTWGRAANGRGRRTRGRSGRPGRPSRGPSRAPC